MTPIDVQSPAEIAEANRVKDEAADDRLLEEWLPRAIEALQEYRGEPLRVSVYSLGYESTENGKPVRLGNRFARLVAKHFRGTPWATSYGQQNNFGFDQYVVFTEAKAAPDTVVQPKPPAEPELPGEPQTIPPPKPGFWRTLRAYLADEEP